MAKQYTKKRSGGKQTSQYRKRKVTKRAPKRASTGSMATPSMKKVIAGEVAKALNSGAQNERRKITMSLAFKGDESQIVVNGKGAFKNCIRIPITEAIPTMAGSSQGPDVRRRTANKILVTGVNVRASFSVSEETRIMLVPYEPHDSVRGQLLQHKDAAVETAPNAKLGLVPESFSTHMLSHFDVGLVSKHGPLMTRKSGSEIELDSVDGTPYESRVSTHAGKPIGPVFRKSFGKGGLRRTLNWDQGGAVKGVGAGYTQWTTELVHEYWKLNKPYTYMYEGMNDQVFERNAELLLYVDCPTLQSRQIPEQIPLFLVISGPCFDTNPTSKWDNMCVISSIIKESK